MTLVKSSILSAGAVAVRVLTSLVLNKVLAIFVGPAGYALIGQLQSLLAIAMSITGGAVSTGVTKYTAEFADSPEKQHSFWKVAMCFSLLSSIIVGATLLFTHDLIGHWVFKQKGMSDVIVWFALSLPVMAVNTLLLAIINGKKEIRSFVVANMLGSALSLISISLLAVLLGLRGALIGVAVNPAVSIFATAIIIAKKSWFATNFFCGVLDRESFCKLSGFALMALTSAICVPTSHMFIREHLTTIIGWQGAGYCQAIWRISETYLMLVTMTLSTYYLPRIAEIHNAKDLKAEILRVYLFAMPFVCFGALMIYFLRNFIVQTLFAPNFAPMTQLFMWQLPGDVVKIAAWILGFVLIGRGAVLPFITSEVISSISFVALVYFFSNSLGLQGVSIAYLANYCLFFLAMIKLTSLEMSKLNKKKAISPEEVHY